LAIHKIKRERDTYLQQKVDKGPNETGFINYHIAYPRDWFVFFHLVT